MMFLGLLSLAVATSALPTQESKHVIFIGPNGVEAKNNVVELSFAPQEASSKVISENGPYTIPPAPQLPPLYLFTYENSMMKSEGNEDGNNKNNEDDKKLEQGKDTDTDESRVVLIRADLVTDYIAPIFTFLVPDDISNFLSTLYATGQKYFMMIKP